MGLGKWMIGMIRIKNLFHKQGFFLFVLLRGVTYVTFCTTYTAWLNSAWFLLETFKM